MASFRFYLACLVAVLSLFSGASLAFTGPEVAKLIANDADEVDRFGNAVALSGDTAIVGASQDDENGALSGAAYIFIRQGQNWVQQAKLLPEDGAAGDQFGYSVALSGDTALVGANQDDDQGYQSGSVYVFTRNGESWTQQAKLTEEEGTIFGFFGNSVSIQGDTALIGKRSSTDPGAAYLFVRQGPDWFEQARLEASDGARGDRFGISVSIHDDIALVGADGDDDNGYSSGSAYIFERQGFEWVETAKLTASDAASTDAFGGSVSLFSDTALIGAKWDDDNGSSSGGAYIFTFQDGGWSQQTKLTASDGDLHDQFGGSVALFEDTALIGAKGDDHSGSLAGSAYVFSREGQIWSETRKLKSSDGRWGDAFGTAVALSADSAIVGAVDDDDNGISSGSAYVFGQAETVALTKPVPGEVLSGSSVEFTWSGDKDGAIEYWFSAGSNPGGEQYHRSGPLGSQPAQPYTVPELPTDGTPVHIRLWYRLARQSWQHTDATYVASTFAEIPTPLLLSPSGTAGSNPSYKWQAAPGAQEYYLWVNDGTRNGAIKEWYSAADAGCTDGTGECMITPAIAVSGRTAWWVQGKSSQNVSTWSTPLYFTAEDPVEKPEKPILLSPASVAARTPSYTWQATPGAEEYYLWVNDSTGSGTIKTWYSAAEAGCGEGLGNCAVTPSTTVIGNTAWWVQGRNSADPGLWSNPLYFTAQENTQAPAQPTLLSPAGVADSTPPYSWQAAPGTEEYYLWVNDSTGSGTIKTWYSAAEAGCSDGTGDCTVTPSTAISGTAEWWVLGRNSAGPGLWSSSLAFTVEVSSPAKPVLLSPSRAAGSKPAYTWRATHGANEYDLWVQDHGGRQTIAQSYSAVEAGCSDGVSVCSITLSTAVSERATWWVKSRNSQGETAGWSEPLSFTVEDVSFLNLNARFYSFLVPVNDAPNDDGSDWIFGPAYGLTEQQKLVVREVLSDPEIRNAMYFGDIQWDGISYETLDSIIKEKMAPAGMVYADTAEVNSAQQLTQDTVFGLEKHWLEKINDLDGAFFSADYLDNVIYVNDLLNAGVKNLEGIVTTVTPRVFANKMDSMIITNNVGIVHAVTELKSTIEELSVTLALLNDGVDFAQDLRNSVGFIDHIRNADADTVANAAAFSKALFNATKLAIKTQNKDLAKKLAATFQTLGDIFWFAEASIHIYKVTNCALQAGDYNSRQMVDCMHHVVALLNQFLKITNAPGKIAGPLMMLEADLELYGKSWEYDDAVYASRRVQRERLLKERDDQVRMAKWNGLVQELGAGAYNPYFDSFDKNTIVPPSNLNVQGETNRIAVSWVGEIFADAYAVYLSENENFNVDDTGVIRYVVRGETVSITEGVRADKDYFIAVAAIRSDYESALSDVYRVKLAENSCTAPTGITPANGATLTAGSQQLNWTNTNTNCQYWVYVGNRAGSSAYSDSGDLGGATNYALTGYPSNSSPVIVTLYYRPSSGGTWQSLQLEFNAPNNNGTTIIDTSWESGADDWSSNFTWSWGTTFGNTPGANSGSRYWFTENSNDISSDYLTSPVYRLGTDETNLYMSFSHRYSMETGYDGGTIEISVEGGAFVPVGQSAVPDYDQQINACCGSAISGQMAYTGTRSVYQTSTVDFSGSVSAGDSFQIRFHQADDSSVSEDGWYIDDLKIWSE